MIRGLLLGIIWMIFCVCSSFQQETPFVYNNFGHVDHLHLDGSARIIPSGGILQLTNATNSQIGHVFYEKPIEFKSSESVSFSTYFVCALLPAGDPSGHGMTFFVSHSTDFKGAEATRYFGIFNRNGSTSTRVLAVELDTSLASDVKDISDNHVGIDVNSAESITSANASYFSDKEGKKIDIKLLSGDPIQVWVDYEGTTLNVSLAPLRNKKPSRPLLSSTSINLTDILQGRRMFVGFSGSTGSSMSYQYILGWSFSKSMASLPNIDISKLPKVPHSSTKKKSTSPVLSVLLGLIAFIVLGILVVAYLYRRNLYSEVREEWEKEYGPHRYSYKSLYKATKGFHKDGFLGKGGFGEVYKGTLPQEDIAVKRFSHHGERGMKQFVAEIASMGCLDHRNLVPLFGYCRRKGEFLLVSKYMPNGSLDQFLFHNREPSLTWSKRLGILKGIASALKYLHTEATQVVLHRDIKASNVMLDTDFTGKLGDFGMARFHDHGANPTTTGAVGTVGYMGPELTSMGASTKTDVYAFGALILEVTCGRRPVEPNLPIEKQLLVKWVCDCWKRKDLISARDPKLSGELIPQIEMVLKLGLLCTNLVPESRPDMVKVVQYLDRQVSLPDFSPDSPGIGIVTPVLVGGSSTVISNISSPVTEFITHSIQYGIGR